MFSIATPPAFYWRRLHSFMGLFLVLFLIEHLLTNSQAALFIGDDGKGFVHAVNFLHSLPYLPLIELFLLVPPFLVHAIWGVMYIFTSKANSSKSDGSLPALGKYSRNRAYTWQRLSSWILIVGLLLHVFQMRFWNYPAEASVDGSHYYMSRVTLDSGLYTLSDRLGAEIFDGDRIDAEVAELNRMGKGSVANDSLDLSWETFVKGPKGEAYDAKDEVALKKEQARLQQKGWVKALKKRPLRAGEVIVVSEQFGQAVLLMVRDTFKIPAMMLLYTLFVLAAAFHAFNGFWTFLITWGLILTQASQLIMRRLSYGLMALLAFWGLAAIWLTYWVNLKG